MSQDSEQARTWDAVDDYIVERLLPADAALDAALAASSAAGLPAINVAPNQGRLLEILARSHGASSILEIGTLGGYSTIWLARALPPGGRLVSLEYSPRHAEVARANLEQAGLSAVTEVRVGAAVDTLAQLADESAGPFDVVFIDADKVHYPEYLVASMRLVRRGSLIIADNVVRGGAILDPATADPDAAGMRRFYDALAGDERLEATVVQTVGTKGHDGFALALVVGEP